MKTCLLNLRFSGLFLNGLQPPLWCRHLPKAKSKKLTKPHKNKTRIIITTTYTQATCNPFDFQPGQKTSAHFLRYGRFDLEPFYREKKLLNFLILFQPDF